MPHSRSRHKHHPQHPTGSHLPKPTRKRSAQPIMAIFLAVFGIGISYFIAGNNTTWLAGGAIIGALSGILIGRGMDKAALKK